MKNETMKKVITAVSVILTSAIIMLIPQLIHTDFQFAEVDWQTLVLRMIKGIMGQKSHNAFFKT